MFEIVRYSEERKSEWNDFVERSKNGTFLIDRNYMDYHSDRFADFSLMFYLKGKLYAVLPANVKDNTVYSHQGLTYGGLIMGEDAKAANTCVLFAGLNDYLHRQGISRVVYKAIPWIYATYPSEEDLYAIIKVCRAKLTGRDISSTVFLDGRIKFGELRRRCSRKAAKAGVKVVGSTDIDSFWKVLDDNLENKYNVAPVHTCAELRMLAELFPENIKLYVAILNSDVVGGVLVYLNKQTVHTQYISASPEGKRCGALDLLFDELINNVFSSYKYFDFGRSTEDYGRYLNEPLIFQKEGFGARGVCYDTYEWDV